MRIRSKRKILAQETPPEKQVFNKNLRWMGDAIFLAIAIDDVAIWILMQANRVEVFPLFHLCLI